MDSTIVKRYSWNLIQGTVAFKIANLLPQCLQKLSLSRVMCMPLTSQQTFWASQWGLQPQRMYMASNLTYLSHCGKNVCGLDLPNVQVPVRDSLILLTCHLVERDVSQRDQSKTLLTLLGWEGTLCISYNHFFLLSFFSRDRVSYRTNTPSTYCIAKGGLSFLVLFLLSPMCWNYMSTPPFLLYAELNSRLQMC